MRGNCLNMNQNEREREGGQRGTERETERKRDTERDRETETERDRERVLSPKFKISVPQTSCVLLESGRFLTPPFHRFFSQTVDCRFYVTRNFLFAPCLSENLFLLFFFFGRGGGVFADFCAT